MLCCVRTAQSTVRLLGLPMGASHHHGVVPHEQRVAVDASCGSLRSAAQYAALGGKNLTARSGGTGIKRAQPRRAQDDADPLICTFDEVVEQHEADAVIAHCERRMRRARVTPDSGRGGEASAGRTNYSTWLRHDSDPCVAVVVQKIVALVGRPAATAEALQVIHYSETQQYRQHWDAYCPLDARGKAACANGGNRLVTALLYLRQPNGGGGTYFPHLDIRVQPIQRSLLVFHNCYPGSRTPHPDSKHAGEPVTRCDAGIIIIICSPSMHAHASTDWPAFSRASRLSLWRFNAVGRNGRAIFGSERRCGCRLCGRPVSAAQRGQARSNGSCSRTQTGRSPGGSWRWR
eukprot:COSAG01_NODE_3064_length_6647_cov_29.485186_2_plen_347_part_00